MPRPSVFPVKAQDVDRIWPAFAPFVEEALSYGLRTHDLEDVRKEVKARQATLWAIMDEDGNPCAAAVTKIHITPKLRIADLHWIGGGDIDKWQDTALKVFARWAQHNACDVARIPFGRKGWERQVPDVIIVGSQCLLWVKDISNLSAGSLWAAAEKPPPHPKQSTQKSTMN